ncbi:hypothetical protein BE17_28975 [Sorangium cellulosum]|uniref:Uncharacterized protein n=1 Tax=Sorangium cellulosum TaxID=56 RepID=A0A150R6Y6_SORCE|nr:hypothetical protein BE17_28975 [Sorangium cellulosum]
MAAMSFYLPLKFRDPKRRVSLTLPARPVTRCVSPGDIERYLSARGYRPFHVTMSCPPWYVAVLWFPPIGPDGGNLPSYHDRYVEGPQVSAHRLEDAIAAIARIEGRTSGEVLREIAVMAQMADE